MRKYPVPGTAAYENYVAIHSPRVEPAPSESAFIDTRSVGHGMSFKEWFWDKGIKQASIDLIKSFDPRSPAGQIAIISFAAGGADPAIVEEGWTPEAIAPALSEKFTTDRLAKEYQPVHPHVDLARAARGKSDIPLSRAVVRSGRDIRERTVGGQAGSMNTVAYIHHAKTPARRRTRKMVHRTPAVSRRGI